MSKTTPTPTTRQTLVTSGDFSVDKYRLLELNPEVEKAILAGEKVTIVGGANQRAVLCTASASFLLAKEDTSNLRLLTPHTTWSDNNTEAAEIQTTGSAAFHYVLQPKVPDVGQLKALLLESPYTRSSDSAPSAKRAKLAKLYSTADLMAELQISEHELMTLLGQLHAFEDAGVWRVLDPAFQSSLFGDILDGIIENDWDFQTQGVSLDDLVSALQQPDVVVRQCCRVYGSVQQDGSGSERCTFDATKIAIFCAKQLFRERDEGHYNVQSFTKGDQGWAVDQFMDKWQLRVPEPVKVSEEMLQGLALMRPQKGKPSRLLYLAEDELPMDPKQRFEKLFEFQEKWTIAQLEPYISALVRPGVTQASLLLKYARSSRQSTSPDRLYSKR